MKRLALIVALCLLTNVSFAEFENGNALLTKFQKCENYENGDTTLSNNWSCGFAMGLVVGVHDTITELENNTGKSPVRVCTRGINPDQVYDVVYKFLKENPSIRNDSAWSLALLAMHDAWPCPEE
jgi:hypothetical protein